MARRVYDADRRQLAYRVWRESNRNLSEALRRLDAEHGWPLSRNTLTGWVEAEQWHERADREDKAAQREAAASAMSRETILADLAKQKERYEVHLQRVAMEGEVDNAATAAYAQLLRVILQVQKDIDAGAGIDRVDLAADVVRQFADYVRREHPAEQAALVKVLPGFADQLARLYG